MDKELEKRIAAHHMEKYGLLPCPYCGGNAYLEKRHRAFIAGEAAIVALVRCVECSARSGRVNVADYGKKSVSGQATKQAIENWNRRVKP